jgi:hypothetical protein
VTGVMINCHSRYWHIISITFDASINAETKRRWADDPPAVGKRAFKRCKRTRAVKVTQGRSFVLWRVYVMKWGSLTWELEDRRPETSCWMRKNSDIFLEGKITTNSDKQIRRWQNNNIPYNVLWCIKKQAPMYKERR